MSTQEYNASVFDALAAGNAAWHNSRDIADNPHPEHTARWDAWNRGYCNAWKDNDIGGEG